jgi:predicted RNA-binding protein with PUA-like domain
MNHWLMKSEPDVYGFEDLLRDGRTHWDGVRNYQARNLMRDRMKQGDRVLFYHSNAVPPGVAGVAEVVREGYPDPSQFDPGDAHFDPQSKLAEPRWICVDVAPVAPLPRLVALEDLRGNPKLAGMGVLQRGNRLSVLPVSAAEFREVLRMGGLAASTRAKKA